MVAYDANNKIRRSIEKTSLSVPSETSFMFSKAWAALLKGAKDFSLTILPNLVRSDAAAATSASLDPISSDSKRSKRAYPEELSYKK